MRKFVVVFDSWWPWRLGLIEKRSKTRTRVRWTDGTIANYDRAHRVRFLRYADKKGVVR